MDEESGKKVHRQRRSGRKAEKKKNKIEHVHNLTEKQRNPKAFALNSAITAERRFRRHQDLDTKKQHVPLVDRTPLEPPPFIIVVVGPPKVGKSTLIRGLIRNFTRQPMVNIKGPVTLISGKRRRITILECNNDINSMIDLAKIADLVLLLIDASFGFEMEIFEFLNICQVHGMPKIMGILTHLDTFKNSNTLKNTKKTLKHRFWTEVYPGAKLFYLSGILHGDYMRNEIQRLGRFISVMKFRPLTWQTSHSYVLADRMEDLTSPEAIRQNQKCDRVVSLYGYVRGIPLNKYSSIHIPGCGDFKISDVCFLPDPCPLPDKLKKRALVDKERLIYAPFSGVGGIVYDKDAVYVELGGSHSHHDGEDNQERALVTSLVATKETLDAKIDKSQVQLFSNAKPISGIEFQRDFDNNTNKRKIETVLDTDGRKRRKVVFTQEGDNADENISESEDEETSSSGDDEIEDEDGDETELNWKADLAQKASDAFVTRQNSKVNIWKLVYGTCQDETGKDDDKEEISGGLFKIMSLKQRQILREKDIFNAEDYTKFPVSHHRDWNSSQVCDSIKDDFVTGIWKDEEDAGELLRLDAANVDSGEEYGDFEDLETGVKVKKKTAMEEELAEKKKKLKEKFDAEYDGKEGNYYDELKEEATKQAELNRSHFEGLDDSVRVNLEGYRPGMYVRVEIGGIPCELVTEFDPTYPLIIGALQPGEENVAFLNVRIKKHRWYGKILKTKNPIIVSVGWRKFQVMPVYYKLEDNFRQRMLKYTPEHATCMANFWGPLTKSGTGFLAVQDVSSKEEGFRIIATGTVVDCNESTQITKKLKLIGEPLKIYRKTAFVKNMFTSALEVAKFEGARLKTVSGIRGTIKRALGKPEGAFRATFEDAIKMSDIIFCRTWYNVDVPKFYNPVTSLLLPLNEKNLWRGMKTVGQLKRERGVKGEADPDSQYTPVHRGMKVSKKLKIPKRLQAQLPFKDKPKVGKIGGKEDLKKQRLAVIRDKHEHKVSELMRTLRVNYREKQNREKHDMRVRAKEYKNRLKMIADSKQQKAKERRREIFTKMSKKEKNKKN